MLSKTAPFLIGLALLFAELYPSAAGADPFAGGGMSSNYFYKQLDNYVVAKKPVVYIIDRINDRLAKDPDALPVAYAWATTMSELTGPDQINSLYYLLRADMADRSVKTVNRKSESYKKFALDALQSIMTFEMMLMADTTRCINEDFDGSVVGYILSPRYDAMGRYIYSLLPTGDMPQVWNNALQTEASLRGRMPNAEICSNAAMIGMLVSNKKSKRAMPPEAKPQYMDDKQWDEARDHLRYSIKDFWRDRYEERTQRSVK